MKTTDLPTQPPEIPRHWLLHLWKGGFVLHVMDNLLAHCNGASPAPWNHRTRRFNKNCNSWTLYRVVLIPKSCKCAFSANSNVGCTLSWKQDIQTARSHSSVETSTGTLTVLSVLCGVLMCLLVPVCCCKLRQICSEVRQLMHNICGIIHTTWLTDTNKALLHHH